jgi:hypothetical protein
MATYTLVTHQTSAPNSFSTCRVVSSLYTLSNPPYPTYLYQYTQPHNMASLESRGPIDHDDKDDDKKDEGNKDKKQNENGDDTEMKDAADQEKKEEEDVLDDEILSLSTRDITARRRLLENDTRIMRSEFQRLTHEKAAMHEKIKDNQDKIENNRYVLVVFKI